jgi:hypothetical protein
MTEKRCFMQFFVIALSFAVVAFFSGYYGILTKIWQTDVTYMTSVIAAVFVASVLYLGFASWRFDERPRIGLAVITKDSARAIADTGIGKGAAYIVTLIGLLGTVIGLSLQLQIMAGIQVGNQASMMKAFALVASALGTAFYATGCGIAASIGIYLVTLNLDWFIDRDGAVE